MSYKNERSFIKRFLLGAILASLVCTAQAQPAASGSFEFTAKSSSKGLLGHFDIAASSFDGSPFQIIGKSNFTSISIIDPLNDHLIDTMRPAPYGAIFDSSSGIPRVTAGVGYQAVGQHNGFYDSFQIITSSQVLFYAGGELDDVSFATTGGAAAVPELATWAMMIPGTSAIGFARRRHKVSTHVSYVV